MGCVSQLLLPSRSPIALHGPVTYSRTKGKRVRASHYHLELLNYTLLIDKIRESLASSSNSLPISVPLASNLAILLFSATDVHVLYGYGSYNDQITGTISTRKGEIHVTQSFLNRDSSHYTTLGPTIKVEKTSLHWTFRR